MHAARPALRVGRPNGGGSGVHNGEDVQYDTTAAAKLGMFGVVGAD
jgi:hypothetical protein